MSLTDATVGVDGGVSRGAGEVLVLAVRNVLRRPAVTILFRKTKIDYLKKEKKQLSQKFENDANFHFLT